MLPLTFILILLTAYQIKETQSRFENSERMNLNLITALAEKETSQIEGLLYDLALNNHIFRTFADAQRDTQLYVTSYNVYSSYDHLFYTYEDLSFLMLYSLENEYYAARDNGLKYLSINERFELREAMEKRFERYFLEDNSIQTRWFTVEVYNRTFLCRVVFNKGLYCACAIDLENMVHNLEARFELSNSLVFRDGQKMLTSLSIDFDNIEDITSEERNPIFFSDLVNMKDFMVVNEQLNGITLSYMWTSKGIIGVMSWSSILLFLITILSIMTLPILYFSLRKNFFLPLDSLVQTMNHIREGNLKATVDDRYACKEFRQVNRTFNEMIKQITNLKIDRYERVLEAKQIKLQFLQAQIRPHFYLNCLKTIYSLAKQGHYNDIENSILLLSTHLRYAFQQNDETVPLREEIRLCDNYVKLFGILTEKAPQFIIHVDSFMFDIQIPPVSLLTLVENSIRFSLTPDKDLKIRLSAKKLLTEEGEIMHITIRDNGIGFSEENLKRLNESTWYETTNEHIGIQNVVRRFRIVYGDDFSIAFSNREGAVQELYIPIKKNRGGYNSDTSDC